MYLLLLQDVSHGREGLCINCVPFRGVCNMYSGFCTENVDVAQIKIQRKHAEVSVSQGGANLYRNVLSASEA